MSVEADAGDTETVQPADRDEMLDLLESGVREAHRKASSGRVYDAENERVRQGWIRVLAYSVGQYRQLRKDKDYDEMEERLERIEEDREVQ